MKKNFSLTSPKHKPDRVVELVKAEINKYLARERRKKLPEGVDFWDFKCRAGESEKSAEAVHIANIGKQIDQLFKADAGSVFVEILATPGHRTKKSRSPISKANDPLSKNKKARVIDDIEDDSNDDFEIDFDEDDDEDDDRD